MITMLIMINMMVTVLFASMKHPLSMGFMLLTQTITVSLISGHLCQNFWFSYILFLIMIGGMLILFMYMTSIASNEKFKSNIKLISVLGIIPMTIFFMEKTNNEIKSNEMIEQFKTTEFMITLNKFINFPMMMILMFIILYLLLALIATVKITNFKQGSIRQMN
uniref:NADH-ubiquinone oxidoreductase chain 6 n=1 Tax=Cteniopus sp. AH-2016 TaxID=1907515 RepID=A0A343C2K1_9CUCU|nr:NADH dehydrogenase subunit 6 [Cteniopus sp. AH-2016]